jgi:hypothetical protein
MGFVALRVALRRSLGVLVVLGFRCTGQFGIHLPFMHLVYLHLRFLAEDYDSRTWEPS